MIALDATDAEAVAADKEALEIAYYDGDSAEQVTTDVTLPTAGDNGTAITWESSVTVTITNNGSVTNPSYPNDNVEVTLTATVSKGAVSDTKSFTLNVRGKSVAPGDITMPTANRVTVTDVPAGATVTVYHEIMFEDEWVDSVIGEAANGTDSTAAVTVTLDHSLTGWVSIDVVITEEGKVAGESGSFDYDFDDDEQYITLGGEVSGQNSPLRIEVGDMGSLKAFLWQDSSYVRQYYGEDAWGSNIYYSAGGNQKHLVTDYYDGDGVLISPGTHTKVGSDTVRTVWLHENGKLRITQTVHYPPNQAYYEKRWKFENLSADKTFTDLRFFHGGDTYFGGIDSASSYWNDVLGMIYVRNPSMTTYGLMGFAGSALSPADAYFGGYYGYGNDWSSEESNLPCTVNPDDVDAGYQLQWNRAALAPGQTWEIVANERWTEAGFLQVMAPSAQMVDPGEIVTYEFLVQSFLAEEADLAIEATSARGWEVEVVGEDTVTIGRNGGTEIVTVQLSIPASAKYATDTLTLRVATSDETVSNSSQVVTRVNLPKKEGSNKKPSGPDTTDPHWPVPDSLFVADVTETTIDLSWHVAFDNRGVEKYRLYLNGEVLDTLGSSPLSYTVTGLEPGKEYEFSLEAGDEAGNWSSDGPSLKVKTDGAAAAPDAQSIILTVGSLDSLVRGQPHTLDASPFIPDATGRTLVPIRFVSEALGTYVEWIEETNQIRITDGTREIFLTVGSEQITVDGENAVIDVAPVIIPPGRAFVPIRFISEILGAYVDYDEVTQQITILLPAGE
ncbi:MAG: stalk domain-containing protein [bacterium]